MDSVKRTYKRKEVYIQCVGIPGKGCTYFIHIDDFEKNDMCIKCTISYDINIFDNKIP